MLSLVAWPVYPRAKRTIRASTREHRDLTAVITVIDQTFI
jgi:hypothetical protein